METIVQHGRPVSVPSPQGREPPGLRAARILSAVMVPLMAVASAGSLWTGGLYQDPSPVNAMLRGYDLVTLVVVVPALFIVVLPPLRRFRAAQLVWTATLVYAVYNYAIYVFGSAFNALFLIHVALFSLSVFALGLALASLDVAAIARGFSARTPVRVVSGLLMLLAIGLGAMWVFYSLRYAITGAAPKESSLVLPAASTHLGYVLDLALLVPGYALAAVLLWRRAGWGYVLGTALLIAGIISQVSYMTALIFQAAAGVAGASWFDPAEPVILGIYLAGAALLLSGLRPAPPPRTGPTPRHQPAAW